MSPALVDPVDPALAPVYDNLYDKLRSPQLTLAQPRRANLLIFLVRSRRLLLAPGLRSKRSRVRVAPGPLWKIFPRLDFGRSGGFRTHPCPAASVLPSDEP